VNVIGEQITPQDSQLLFLPMAHSFAKILLLASLERGVKVGFATSPQHLVEEMPIFRPTYIAAVPRIFEKVFNTAQQRAADDGKGSIFEKGVDVAVKYSEETMAGNVSLGTKALHWVFDKLMYQKLRDVFGGQIRSATSGGGPLSSRLGHFFHGIGIEVYEGYGLTETSPVLTANHPHAWKIGTVGKPVPGTTIRIADDGEILAKGGQIFQGYWKNDEATEETMVDGWFATGDIGELDEDGFLKITGRKKEIIVTAGGKNVAPSVLEERLKSHALVSQAMVVGDDKPFIGALITLDEEALPSWQKRNDKEGMSVEELADDPDIQREVESAVEHANKAVSKAESIREYRILPTDFTIEGDELTPTMKLKRRVVEERYGDAIEDIYSGK
jgi:long-chain acyl-CoA synthetase